MPNPTPDPRPSASRDDVSGVCPRCGVPDPEGGPADWHAWEDCAVEFERQRDEARQQLAELEAEVERLRALSKQAASWLDHWASTVTLNRATPEEIARGLQEDAEAVRARLHPEQEGQE